MVKGYKDLLLGKTVIPDESVVIDATTEAGKQLEKIKRKNEEAICRLTLSCTDLVCLGIIEGSINDAYPEGNCQEAWKQLVSKFEPSTSAELIELKRKFNKSMLSNFATDPDPWITELELLRRIINLISSGEITEDDLMIHILSNVPKEYYNLVENLECRIGATVNVLTVSEIKERMRARFSRLNKNGKEDKTANNENCENVLFTKSFKGKCNKCGEFGHKAADCGTTNNKRSNGGRFNNRGRSQGKGRGSYNSNNNNSNNNNTSKLHKVFTPVTCNYCNTYGHMEKHCNKKLKNQNNNNQNTSENVNIAANNDNSTSEVVLCVNNNIYETFDDDIWIGDSAAASHLTNNKHNLMNLRTINESIKMGNGDVSEVIAMGDLYGTILTKNGKEKKITLKDVKYAPGLMCNLISLTKCLKQGLKIESVGLNIKIKSGENELLSFDRQIKSGKEGYLAGVKIVRNQENLHLTMTNKKNKIDIMKLHEFLGHPNEVYTRETAKLLELQVTGNFEPCENCALSKAKMMNIPKISKRTTEVGKRLYLDISTIKNNNPNGSKHWILLVDEGSGMCWSLFVKTKSDMPQAVINWLKELRNTTLKSGLFNVIRCDNAGENKVLEKLCIECNMGIRFEYTAPQTPQQNGVVERLFPTLSGKVRAMMNHAGFTSNMRSYFWTECANTATKLEGLMQRNKRNVQNIIWALVRILFGAHH